MIAVAVMAIAALGPQARAQPTNQRLFIWPENWAADLQGSRPPPASRSTFCASHPAKPGESLRENNPKIDVLFATVKPSRGIKEACSNLQSAGICRARSSLQQADGYWTAIADDPPFHDQQEIPRENNRGSRSWDLLNPPTRECCRCDAARPAPRHTHFSILEVNGGRGKRSHI